MISNYNCSAWKITKLTNTELKQKSKHLCSTGYNFPYDYVGYEITSNKIKLIHTVLQNMIDWRKKLNLSKTVTDVKKLSLSKQRNRNNLRHVPSQPHRYVMQAAARQCYVARLGGKIRKARIEDPEFASIKLASPSCLNKVVIHTVSPAFGSRSCFVSV